MVVTKCSVCRYICSCGYPSDLPVMILFDYSDNHVKFAYINLNSLSSHCIFLLTATISPASAEASPAPLSTHSSRHQSPMLDISPELIDSGTSTPVRIIQASGSPNLPRSFKSRSRSPRRRSRSPRQRSPSLRHRSRSPRRRRKRSKTPPSSYDYRSAYKCIQIKWRLLSCLSVYYAVDV